MKFIVRKQKTPQARVPALICAVVLLVFPQILLPPRAQGPYTVPLSTEAGEAAERNRRGFETADMYRFSKNQVKYPERYELPVVIRNGRESVFEIVTPAEKLSIAALSAVSGQPLAGLLTSAQRADFIRGELPVLGGQYIGDKLCLTAVIPGDTGSIVGWNALPDSAFADGVDGTFTMRNFSLEKVDTLRVGRTLWRAKAPLAKKYRVEPGRSLAVTVKLSPRAGAVYAAADGGRSLYYGGVSGAQHTFEPNGGTLFLFGTADGSAVEMEVYASAAPRQTPDVLTIGNEIIRQHSVDTREIVKIKNGGAVPGRLFLSGSVDSAGLIGRSGQLTRNIKDGGAIPGDGGILLVNSAPGLSKIRLCADDGSLLGQNECRWGEPLKNPDDAQAVTEMSRLTMADGTNHYTMELTEPTHVSLSAPAPAPAAAIIAVDGRVREYREFWDGLAWDIPLGPGKFTIGIKPLDEQTLAGTPLTAGLYPIAQLTEGEPLKLHLMPGQRHIAKFVLKKRSKIGLGLAAKRGHHEMFLLDSLGGNLNRGRQIFTELDSGTYHVLLSTPPNSGGTEAKLYLFGQDNPPANPPDELMRWFTGTDAGPRP